jgi:hypothetical protein
MIMYESTFEGIRFIEGKPAKCHLLEPVKIEIGGVIQSAQLKNLDDVKRLMAQAARSKGGNAIVGFTYGQRSVGYFRSIFQRDDVNWYGEGWIARIP